ncbi:MAG: vWA domain-containing protein [Dehalococcoidia bacterium]|jgi:uncharacterized protein YegL
MAKKVKKVTTTTTVTEEIIEGSSNEKTQIVCILDRSGSMSEGGIIYEAINGFNRFLKEQKELKDQATITVALFDDRYELLYDDIDIKKVPEITYATWTPRGTTALLDAIGKTVNTVKSNHIRLGSEKPAKVLVCIVTDGKENASHEYTREGIRSLIRERERDNWNFIYLAANQDAFAVGQSFGISHHNNYTYAASGAGMMDMSSVLGNATTSYRSMVSSSADFQTRSKSLLKDEGDAKDNLTDNINVVGTIKGNDTYFSTGTVVYSGGTTTNSTGVPGDVNFTAQNVTVT